MKRVFIAVGHGGKDPGAVGNGLKEKQLALAIAKYEAAELERHGVIVGMSKTKDEDDPLAERIKECNAFKPDLAQDVHINAGGGDGAEVFYHYKGGTSKELAENLLDSIKAETGQNSRGAKIKKNAQGRDWFGFIRETVCPAVIVECAFIDNKADIAIIDTAEEQKKMGIALAKGTLKTLGVAYKPEAPKQEPVKATVKKTVTEIAKEVLDGKWGNGAARKSALTKAGYNYAEVQAKVNELAKKGTAKTEPAKENYRVHTVQRGESLWLLATRYLGSGTRYAEIMKLNGKKTTSLKVGEKLKIPNK